jgi:TonB family protein
LPYPQGFKGAQSGDAVAIQLLIKPDGTVMGLQVVSPDSDPELARAALQQAVKMTFRSFVGPDGRPRTTLGTMNVHFAGN